MLYELSSDEFDFETRMRTNESYYSKFVFDYFFEVQKSLVNPDNESDWTRKIFMCDVLIDYAWEMLNTNIWVFVHDCWRLLYAFATLYKILCIKLKNDTTESDEIVKLCDLGRF